VNRNTVEQLLRDYHALRNPETDPELEAVRAAILVEDVFDVVLSDAEIDATVLGDASAAAALVAGLRRAV